MSKKPQIGTEAHRDYILENLASLKAGRLDHDPERKDKAMGYYHRLGRALKKDGTVDMHILDGMHGNPLDHLMTNGAETCTVSHTRSDTILRNGTVVTESVTHYMRDKQEIQELYTRWISADGHYVLVVMQRQDAETQERMSMSCQILRLPYLRSNNIKLKLDDQNRVADVKLQEIRGLLECLGVRELHRINEDTKEHLHSEQGGAQLILEVAARIKTMLEGQNNYAPNLGLLKLTWNELSKRAQDNYSTVLKGHPETDTVVDSASLSEHRQKLVADITQQPASLLEIRASQKSDKLTAAQVNDAMNGASGETYAPTWPNGLGM